ncbi:stonustoxin subunit beta [Gadus morhua]|uniref:stonustoxin subunit beta n=1 Tax=Gadus morhua TaxID=8049 RepID=UPI0011B54FAF|nr:stonustoxin subunit beta-like [Gadus morhua]XP_030211025.1 stonustoxin subunit beta-like [Gadus morhua]
MASATFWSEEDFSCSICLDVFNSPVFTPCGHNFCRTCIATCWDVRGQCRCPFCNELFHTRPDLRVNTLISEMVDRFRSSLRGKTQPCVEPDLRIPEGSSTHQGLGDVGGPSSVIRRDLVESPGTAEGRNTETKRLAELRSAPNEYACDLTMDPNTTHRDLSLSEDNRKVIVFGEDQSYPDHPERFDSHYQVLCREALTGRCYWEVEIEEVVVIGVTYRGIARKGKGGDSGLGWNNKSWILRWDKDGYTAVYNGIETVLPLPPAGSTRVGVYLDRPAGSLSFYRVSPGGGGSSDTLTHLHTFWSSFTQEDLLPGFGVWDYYSTVTL